MDLKSPKVNVDILIVKNGKILFGLLTKKWSYRGKQVYGFSGRDIRFGEKFGQTIKRNVKEDLGCQVKNYKIFCVNANYALNNHYIGIGVAAEIKGKVKNLMTEDWEKWEWFEKDKLPKNLFPAAKNLVDSYLKKKVCISE
jgi:ADP-ribose pyrophosphatase YjhB (NUDIX family)